MYNKNIKSLHNETVFCLKVRARDRHSFNTQQTIKQRQFNRNNQLLRVLRDIAYPSSDHDYSMVIRAYTALINDIQNDYYYAYRLQ